ncbi:MAG: imidazole glycerol phosphate synthase subunit HisH [Actinomycetota bacterium]|nr:imidazole glycerol phosphate synthase subunit HisH [Actinomycetota bacterium]
MTRLALLDYGMGNLRSVEKALERAGADVDLVTTIDGIDSEGVVVPGQGAFGACRIGLERADSVDALREWILDDRPFLGICLGLQILFEGSEEAAATEGLGLIPGIVRRLPDTVKVPHIGWNRVRFRAGVPAFAGIDDGTYFYFDHSYAPEAESQDAVAWTDHGVEFACGVARGAMTAVQFHPEKSGEAGLGVLENFVKECASA